MRDGYTDFLREMADRYTKHCKMKKKRELEDAPPAKPVPWHVSEREWPDNSIIVEAQTAWRAFELANLCGESGVPLPFSGVQCVLSPNALKGN